jgi:hypothetical protein
VTGPTITAVHVLSSTRPNQAPSRCAVGAPDERRAHIIRIDFEKGSYLDAYRIHYDQGMSVQISAERVTKIEWKENTE